MYALQTRLAVDVLVIVGRAIELLKRRAGALSPITQEVVEHLLPRPRVDLRRLREHAVQVEQARRHPAGQTELCHRLGIGPPRHLGPGSRGSGHGPFGQKAFKAALLDCVVLIVVGVVMVMSGADAASAVGTAFIILAVFGFGTSGAGLPPWAGLPSPGGSWSWSRGVGNCC